MKNTKNIHDRPERASSLFRKWKGGLDNESILKEKWLTFHDHFWLNFKRPLTITDDTNNFWENKRIIGLNELNVLFDKCAQNHFKTIPLISFPNGEYFS